MNQLDQHEEQEFLTVGRFSQGLLGVFLLAFTLFTAFFAARDFVWLFQRIRLHYVEPAISGAALAMTPWLLSVSYRLITGVYQHRDLVSPVALILLGVGLCLAGALVWKSGFMTGQEASQILTIGAGACSLGWYRARRT